MSHLGRLGWFWHRLMRRIWVRVSAFALGAVLVAALAQGLGTMIPEGWADLLGAQAVDRVLEILASSMLAVTTFSLSIAVTAFGSAAQSATPRAEALLQQDETAQTVLAIFLGAFLFGLIGVIALKAGFYSAGGRFVLFVATVVVIALVVVALIRWIEHLSHFGRIPDTLDRIEAAAAMAVDKRMAMPFLGAEPLRHPPPTDSHAVTADKLGYVRHIDIAALSQVAQTLGMKVWVMALPGDFVHPHGALCRVSGPAPTPETANALRAAFACARSRTFEQDPEHGLIVLAEVAARALSPGINDPGTAVDVLSRIGRVLSSWHEGRAAQVAWPGVHVPGLDGGALLTAALRPILRDGGDVVEVMITMAKVLDALEQGDPDTFAAPAAHWRERMETALGALPKPDLDVYRAAVG